MFVPGGVARRLLRPTCETFLVAIGVTPSSMGPVSMVFGVFYPLKAMLAREWATTGV